MQKNPSYSKIISLILFATFLILIIIKFEEVLDILNTIFNALLPFILGFFIAYILNILVRRYEKILPKKTPTQQIWSRGIAVFASILTILTFFGVVAFFAIPQLIHSLAILIQTLPAFYKFTTVKTDEYLTALLPTYHQLVIDSLNHAVSDFNLKTFNNALLKVVHLLQMMLSFVFNFVLALIFSIFILLNKERLKTQFRRLGKAFLSPRNYQRCSYILKVSNDTLSSFIIGQFLDATILGCMVTSGLFLFGVSYPLTIGSAIGLLALIPMLGAYLGGLMGVIILLPLGLSQSLIFLIVLVVIQQIESNLIYPRVVGGSIGLPGMWTFMAITCGGFLYGVLGMIISVPLAAILYKLLRQEVAERLGENNSHKLF